MDCSQQMFAHDWVVFSLNSKRAVFLRDQLDRRTKCVEVFNVRKISTYRICQSCGLLSTLLVSLIEKGLYPGLTSSEEALT